MHDQKLNVALIGAGHFGTLHLQVLHRLPNVNVSGVYDIDPSARERLNDLYPDVHFYSDLNSLLSEKSIHAVHITSDESTHYELAMSVLEAGKHAFIEKPLATTAAEARDIVDLAKRRGCKIGVGHILRHDFRHVAMHEAVTNGSIGRLQVMTFRRNFKREAFDRYGRINAYITALVHDIDLAHFFSGEKMRVVSGFQAYPGYRSYRYNTAILETESGIIANLENLWLLPNHYPHDMEYECVLYGTKGVLRLRIEPDLEWFGEKTQYFEHYLEQALCNELQSFVQHVLQESPFTPSPEECVHTIEIAENLMNTSQIIANGKDE